MVNNHCRCQQKKPVSHSLCCAGWRLQSAVISGQSKLMTVMPIVINHHQPSPSFVLIGKKCQPWIDKTPNVDWGYQVLYPSSLQLLSLPWYPPGVVPTTMRRNRRALQLIRSNGPGDANDVGALPPQHVAPRGPRGRTGQTPRGSGSSRAKQLT